MVSSWFFYSSESDIFVCSYATSSTSNLQTKSIKLNHRYHRSWYGCFRGHKKLFPLLGFQTRNGKNYTRYIIMASYSEVLVRDVS